MSSFSVYTLVPSATDKDAKQSVNSYISRLSGQTTLFMTSQRTVEEIFGNVSANIVSSDTLESISLCNRTFIAFQLYRFLDLMTADEKTDLIKSSTDLIQKHYQDRVDKYNAYNEENKDNDDIAFRKCRSYRYLISTSKDLTCRHEPKILGSFEFKNVNLYVLKYKRPSIRFKSMATIEDVKRENKIEIFEQGRNIMSQYSRFPTAFPSHLLG